MNSENLRIQYMQLHNTRRARFYQNGSNKCNLCSEEKIAILQANPVNTLNQKIELVPQCLRKAK